MHILQTMLREVTPLGNRVGKPFLIDADEVDCIAWADEAILMPDDGAPPIPD